MPVRRALLAIALTAACSHALAQDADAISLGTVRIFGNAPVKPLTWVTHPKSDPQSSSSSDAADALKQTPGFTAIRNGGTNADPVLRGMFGSRINIVTDDSHMSGACPARMDNSLSYIASENIDELMVVKGPQTVQWGPGSSAGTVRFVNRLEPLHESTANFSGNLLVGGQSRNDQSGSLKIGNAKGYVSANAKRTESDDYRDGNGDVVPSRWRKWNANVAGVWTPTPDTAVELSAGRGDGIARYAGRSMDGSQFKLDQFGIRGQHALHAGPIQQLDFSAKQVTVDHIMDNFTLRKPSGMGMMGMPMAAQVESRMRSERIAAQWRHEVWSGVFGIDAQQLRHRQRVSHGTSFNGVAWDTDAQLRNMGAFGEFTRTMDAAKWISGVRVDRAQARNVAKNEQRRELLFSGFSRIERQHPQGLTTYAGLGAVQRMPDYWELFSAYGPNAATTFNRVQPEKTLQLDAGLRKRVANGDVWLAAYAGRVNDFILFDYVPGGMMGLSTQVRNVNARTAGFELGSNQQVSRDLRLSASLAYAWAKNTSDNRPLPQVAPLEANITALYQFSKWQLESTWRGVARQGRVAKNQGNVVGRDLSPTGGFSVVNLQGSRDLTPRVKLMLGIDNLFNRYYVEHLNLAGSADFGYPATDQRIAEPGRQVWLKLTVK